MTPGAKARSTSVAGVFALGLAIGASTVGSEGPIHGDWTTALYRGLTLSFLVTLFMAVRTLIKAVRDSGIAVGKEKQKWADHMEEAEELVPKVRDMIAGHAEAMAKGAALNDRLDDFVTEQRKANVQQREDNAEFRKGITYLMQRAGGQP